MIIKSELGYLDGCDTYDLLSSVYHELELSSVYYIVAVRKRVSVRRRCRAIYPVKFTLFFCFRSELSWVNKVQTALVNWQTNRDCCLSSIPYRPPGSDHIPLMYTIQ